MPNTIATPQEIRAESIATKLAGLSRVPLHINRNRHYISLAVAPTGRRNSVTVWKGRNYIGMYINSQELIDMLDAKAVPQRNPGDVSKFHVQVEGPEEIDEKRSLFERAMQESIQFVKRAR